MYYCKFETDKNISLKKWNNSQFELADIVLSLTDQKITYGAKIYAIFLRPEILSLIEHLSFDFAKIKTQLGINGFYVDRNGDVFSENFNPKRNYTALTLSKQEMKKQAKLVYLNIFKDLVEIINK
jgi:hypothetical protein